MVSSDFNQLMDNYISNRKSKDQEPIHAILKSKRDKGKQEEEFVPDGVSSSSVYVIKKPKSFLRKLIDRFSIMDEEGFEEYPRVDKKESENSEQEFEQELDEMTRDEKKTTFFGWIAKFFSISVDEEYEDIDDVGRIELGEQKSEEKQEDRFEHMTDHMDMETDEKGSFISNFLNFFGISVEKSDEHPEELYEPVVDRPKEDVSMQKMIEMKEDLKDIAVIAIAIFKKLPKKHFQELKSSTEFEKFKIILKKHNVIRVKDNQNNIDNIQNIEDGEKDV